MCGEESADKWSGERLCERVGVGEDCGEFSAARQRRWSASSFCGVGEACKVGCVNGGVTGVVDRVGERLVRKEVEVKGALQQLGVLCGTDVGNDGRQCDERDMPWRDGLWYWFVGNFACAKFACAKFFEKVGGAKVDGAKVGGVVQQRRGATAGQCRGRGVVVW